MRSFWFHPLRAALLSAVLSAALVAAYPARTVAAHVLEGPHVLDLTAEAMGRIAALQVDQKLLIYPESPDVTPTVLDETATYIMPQRFRSDIQAERIRRTYLVFGESAMTVIDGRMAVGESPFDRYQGLLRSRTREQLMHSLGRMGVETAISSLGRVDDAVVYVIGARYPDESVSQLAVDKETFLPLRLLLVDRPQDADGARLAIYYRSWRKVQKGWFPFQVTFHAGDRLVRELRVADLRDNPSVPAEMMDLEALKASLALDAAQTPQAQKQEAVEAVRKAVQEFRKKFE
ncbi:MAG TPA: hypothetical protein VLT88_04625 [Desulfosarcina sp.]|nr:hypothetical protein [Desulfosarcina sp.]